MAEKLVLWKPRPQRLAEAFIIPLVLLPVGPVLRAVLRDDYDIFYGLALVFALLFLTVFAGRQWALAHGGEWVTAPERLERLLAEVAVAPRWKTALVNGLMYALIICAMIFIIEPIDEFGAGLGGPAIMLGFIGLLALVAVIPILTGRQRRLASIAVDKSEAPMGHVLSQAMRLLPRSYLATLIATIAGVFVGLKLPDSLRVAGFAVAMLLILQILRQLPFFGKLPTRLYASFGGSGFWNYILLGLLSWGVPYAIMFAGLMLLLDAGQPIAIVPGLGYMIGVGILTGFFMGTLLYLINRASQRRAGKPA